MAEDVSSLRAVAHPVRLRMLSLLTGTAMSAAEIARELDLTHANASYHLRVLAEAGEVVEAGEERIRGGVAKRYRHPWDRVRPSPSHAMPTPAPARAARRPGRPTSGRSPASWSAASGCAAVGTRAHLTDAEVWVSPEVWEQAVALVDEAARLVHAEAQPPRSAGTVHVNLSAALFSMTPARDEAPRRAGAAAGPALRLVLRGPGHLHGRLGDGPGRAGLRGPRPLRLGRRPRRRARRPDPADGAVPAVRRRDRPTGSPARRSCGPPTCCPALTQATVAALVITGQAELWMLIALEAANGTVAAFSMPAMESVVPQLVPRAQLQQANALLSFSRAGLSVVGPTVAALLVATVGRRLGARRSTRCPGWSPRCCSAGCGSPRRCRPTGRAAACCATCARAGRRSPGTPGCGSWWPASGCSTRSTPAPGSPSGRPSPGRRSASGAGATCCRRSRSGCWR